MNPQDYNSSVDSEKFTIKFNIDNWKIRNYTRKGEKVRLIINLDKDQTLAFNNFKKVCKPDEVSDDKFIKTIFLMGVETMNNQLQDVLKKYVSENKEQLAASGIIVTEGEDGELSLSDADADPSNE